MFKKVLIANRGEIAVRIAQTLQEMGIVAAAVYSDVDKTSLHVRAADEAYHLSGETSAETYLQGPQIIALAQEHGVDAIHPGYGFLSENEDFAQSCRNAGLVFIGPSPEVICLMGDKIEAKKIFSAAGVPVVPGWYSQGSLEPELVQNEAQKIGYPVLIKAAAGGGGKGMKVAQDVRQLWPAIESAQREAHSAFGDSRVFLEKYISHPRHVEVQILGDHHGQYVHLFERECSIQRRHQKIVEESPSPALTSELREKMTAAAVRAAQAVHYTNAGTVEFILDNQGQFYFLEVNTRLQVEHPVTEMVTLKDLVRVQILIAAGEKLPFTQQELTQTGHAIECRVYAEDPAKGFLPAIGRIEKYIPPCGPGIRVDSGVSQGSVVSVHYDPMLAKLIVWGQNRREALQKMQWALRRFVILGITTNIEFLQALMEHPDFCAGRFHTHFLQEHPIDTSPNDISSEAILVAAWASTSAGNNSTTSGVSLSPAATSHQCPWQSVGMWRG